MRGWAVLLLALTAPLAALFASGIVSAITYVNGPMGVSALAAAVGAPALWLLALVAFVKPPQDRGRIGARNGLLVEFAIFFGLSWAFRAWFGTY